MNLFPMNSSVKVWLATGHTDMRCGFPTLALRVQEILKHDPLLCVVGDYVAAGEPMAVFQRFAAPRRHII